MLSIAVQKTIWTFRATLNSPCACYCRFDLTKDVSKVTVDFQRYVEDNNRATPCSRKQLSSPGWRDDNHVETFFFVVVSDDVSVTIHLK